MTTITIPKKLEKEKDLVVIPKREYEKLLSISKKPVKKLDRDLEKALAEIKAGKVFGPFRSMESLMKSLDS